MSEKRCPQPPSFSSHLLRPAPSQPHFSQECSKIKLGPQLSDSEAEASAVPLGQGGVSRWAQLRLWDRGLEEKTPLAWGPPSPCLDRN